MRTFPALSRMMFGDSIAYPLRPCMFAAEGQRHGVSS